MEPIQASLKKWMRENKNFKQQYVQMRESVLSDPAVKQLLFDHPELTTEQLDKHLVKLYEFTSQSKNCDACQSLNECDNILKGYTPHLYVENGDIRIAYDKCFKKIKNDEKRKKESLVESLYMPKDILNASIADIDHRDKERSEAVRKVIGYLEMIGTEYAEKGIYFHGPFGVGKTYFLGALANELAEKNISSMLIYMPEFVRAIKASLKDDSINQKIEHFKKTPVLMLDDIGAESQSAWFRDEILGSILQYRMMERLPVFFTSNYSLKQLEQHLATTNRGDTETVKAGRIIERIKQVSREVPLYGKNRRM
ncbi:primosomal protein DnaI [Aquibacillus sp. 3ASR75-11]|uniref:Primosomal protein DnaI n=1 Tax=Terrihalobacillus insolitus TaxID=2950438 RepID=A0A9X3WPY3_9BACI|nr:primosomal protein DnaI [Terrihalobacillus insolitus]MDC3412606.1 primosomal protein DnaI [Terrihalobacillus insolitus]MDC3423957.1 primosomal protein DnaI [Terrihalobacillus insolitus]